ncbi:MAG: hypothetical protein KJ731_15470, partial [Alphaproteobacteria bacterium]|nr:hypothetical protein [Alphaproteobacteria bacterium]
MSGHFLLLPFQAASSLADGMDVFDRTLIFRPSDLSLCAKNDPNSKRVRDTIYPFSFKRVSRYFPYSVFLKVSAC